MSDREYGLSVATTTTTTTTTTTLPSPPPTEVRLIRHFRHSNDTRTTITALLELTPDGTLVVGSRQLKRWTPDGLACLQTFHGHSSGVISGLVQIAEDSFVSSSHDRTLKRWSLKTGQCLQTFLGPQDPLECLVLCSRWKTTQQQQQWHDEGRSVVVAGGCGGGLIWFWRIDTEDEDTNEDQSFKQLVGHSEAVLSLCEMMEEQDEEGGGDGGGGGGSGGVVIVSGSVDKTVRLWNISSGERHTLKGHTKAVGKVIELAPQRLLSSSTDGTVRLWNTGRGAMSCLRVFDSGFTKGGMIYLAKWDDRCFVSQEACELQGWLWRTSSCTSAIDAAATTTSTIQQRLFSRCEPSNCEILRLRHQENVLISGTTDGCVCLWNLLPRRLVDSCCMSIAKGLSESQIEQLATVLPKELMDLLRDYSSLFAHEISEG
eukprot:TRINITY_DN16486_c0_g1_i1.p1 TRINITY_DN16486_c0_g1~~TRINITY_DN16486_c0_g1_i1.p1  ORF type:complete len:430 (-),score=86.05 TRINITY_DN16486_c0_g1_i1:100-1389(-)